MSFYPPKISARFYEAKYCGRAGGANAVGTSASFLCGSFVRFYLLIDAATKEIRAARFTSNGCGYATAAADVLAETIVGRRLTELHGLDRAELAAALAGALEEFPAGRRHCAALGRDALEQALADFRARQLEEFAGEKALICTCFGVSEETIERVIADEEAETIEDVGRACHAGTGCGSCRMLIEELLDVYWREREA